LDGIDVRRRGVGEDRVGFGEVERVGHGRIKYKIIKILTIYAPKNLIIKPCRKSTYF
jgi:hypothetical protein